MLAAGAVAPLDPAVLTKCQNAIREAAQEAAAGTTAPSLLRPRRPRARFALPAVGMAAAVVALAVLMPGLPWGGEEPAGTTDAVAQQPSAGEGPAPTGPLGGAAGALCAEEYNMDNLTHRDFAFDGTVTASGSEGESGKVSFDVQEWFRGGSERTAVVELTPPGLGDGRTAGMETGPAYQVGTRLLVSGEPRFGGPPLKDAIAWSCGFSRYYDAATAAAWRQAFQK